MEPPTASDWAFHLFFPGATALALGLSVAWTRLAIENRAGWRIARWTSFTLLLTWLLILFWIWCPLGRPAALLALPAMTAGLGLWWNLTRAIPRLLATISLVLLSVATIPFGVFAGLCDLLLGEPEFVVGTYPSPDGRYDAVLEVTDRYELQVVLRPRSFSPALLFDYPDRLIASASYEDPGYDDPIEAVSWDGPRHLIIAIPKSGRATVTPLHNGIRITTRRGLPRHP